jgi:hypothetical protein
MNSDVIHLFFAVIAAIVLAYNLYQIWFTPERYIKALVKGAKYLWPFTDFYRKWYVSKSFLWLFRVTYLLFFLIIISILCLSILGMMGLFP